MLNAHTNIGDNMYYLKYFFITSILGFFLESFVSPGYESGILYGPWTPVYGIGSIIIILISDSILKDRNINVFFRFFLLFFSCFLILSLAELIGGLFIEKFFGVVFWDYSNYRYNVGRYICLEISLIWGAISILFVFIRPFIDFISKYISDLFIYILFCLFFVDIVFTLCFR